MVFIPLLCYSDRLGYMKIGSMRKYHEQPLQTAEKFRVIDKIGRPQHFRDVDKILDEELEEEWRALYNYMNENGVDLAVCSPNITARELYRFTTQELFDLETDNISMPGMMTCFIYDDFYPDHKYDNQRIAVEECIEYFFEKGKFFDYHFAEIVQFNHYANLTKAELRKLARDFKAPYDKIRKTRIEAESCRIDGDYCIITGVYEAIFTASEKNEFKEGNWLVEFVLDKEFEHWHITRVQIEGIELRRIY